MYLEVEGLIKKGGEIKKNIVDLKKIFLFSQSDGHIIEQPKYRKGIIREKIWTN